MAKKPLPSQEVLRQLLSYDPSTGKLFWKERGPEWFEGNDRLTAVAQANAWNGRNAGREAFTAPDRKGYLQGKICRYHTTAHRVIWAWLHGEWPDCIDHIDGRGTNNAASNLRKVSLQQNARNMAMPRSNTTGVVGVRMQKRSGQWEAHIGSRSTYRFLGTFGCMTAAVIARKKAEMAMGYHANHGTRERLSVRTY